MYLWAWTVNAIYFFFFYRQPNCAIACLIGIPISIAATVLHEKGFKLLATLFRTLTAVSIIGYISWITGRANSPILFWLLSVVLGAMLVFGLKAGLVVFGVSLGLVLGLVPFTEDVAAHLTTFTMLALLPYMLVIGIVFVRITNHYMQQYLAEKGKVEESLQHLQNIYDNIPQKIAIFGKHADQSLLLKGRSRLESDDTLGVLRELGFTEAQAQKEHLHIVASLQGERGTFDAQAFTIRVQSASTIYSLKWSPVYDPAGQIRQIILTAEDVTQIEEERRNESERALRRFLPPHIVQDIREGRMTIDDRPRSQHITVLFSDIVDFTRISEQLGPENIAAVLNEYRETMIDIVFSHNGTIDKFIGDAIMILFGAPKELDQETQVLLATQCAQDMQNALLRLNSKWESQQLKPLFMRIGIHTGDAIVGTFGNALRSEYTAIGSTVNMASRIEGAASPGTIFISSQVKEHLPERNWVPVGRFHLKGLGPFELFQMDFIAAQRAV